MKLSKREAKAHEQAMELVHSDRTLRLSEREFILDNYQESVGSRNSLSGAFFTPSGLARDFSIEVNDGARTIDLCAGIGRLSYALEEKCREQVCVEFCPEYAEVGKRVLPNAYWIEGDVFNVDQYRALGAFDWAISNPPFGRVKGDRYEGPYRGGEFEFKVIELASRLATFGAFILPQMSAPFRYSGEQCYRVEINDKVRAFMDQTGIHMEPNCGIDTTVYRDDWNGVSPVCEIVITDFEDLPKLASAEEQIDMFSGEAA